MNIEAMKRRLGEKITISEVVPAAQEGDCVAVLCDCRRTLKEAMDVFEHKLDGNFLANYSHPLLTLGKGSIAFFIVDSPERLAGYRSDCYIELGNKI